MRTTPWVLGILATCSALTSATASATEDGKVVLARGTVTVRTNDGARDAVPGTTLSEGDQVQTGSDGTVRLLIAGNAVVDLAAGTSMVMTRSSSSGEKTRLKLWSGRLWARVSKLFGSSEFEVEGPNAVAGVRGTEFVVEVAADGSTDINVIDGAVAVNNRDGGPQQLLGAGDHLGAATGRELTTSKSSASARNALRTSTTAGLHLNPSGVAGRLGALTQHLPHGVAHGGHHAPRIGDKLPVPPLDIDPAAGRIRLRGQLNIVQ